MRTRRTRNYAAQTMESSSISFGELAKQFLEDRKARGNASQTIKHYGQSIRKLETFFAYRTCGKEEYTLLTREEAIDCGASVQCSILDEKNLDSSFRSFLYEVEGLGEQTVNTYFRDYRVIVYYAIDQQLVRERNIIVKSAETGVKDVYTADELEKLLRKPDQDCIFSEYRNWVVVNYLLATGNRVGTIVNLKISDLDFDDYMIAVNTQKNKRKTRIPMEREQLAKILRHYIDEWLTDENGRYTTEFLFPSSYSDRLLVGKKDGTIQFKSSEKSFTWKNIVSLNTGNGDYTVALKADGTVVATEDNYGNTKEVNLSDWKNIVFVSAGRNHVVGLRADGTVVARGDNSAGQCNVSKWKKIVDIYAMDDFTLGLRADGTVLSTSSDYNTSGWQGIQGTNRIDDMNRIKKTYYDRGQALKLAGKDKEAADAFAAIGNYRDAADELGKICYNHAQKSEEAGNIAEAAIWYGKAGNYQDANKKSNTLWNQIAKRNTIAAYGEYCTLAVLNNGTVETSINDNWWWTDEVKKTKKWKNVIAIADGQSLIGLKADGTVLSTDNSTSQWKKIVAIAGGNVNVGLRTDGTVIASTPEYTLSIYDTGEWENIIAIASGYDHIIALRADGTVVATGNNEYNQCNVEEWKDIVAIAAGGNQSFGVKKGKMIFFAHNTSRVIR